MFVWSWAPRGAIEGGSGGGGGDDEGGSSESERSVDEARAAPVKRPRRAATAALASRERHAVPAVDAKSVLLGEWRLAAKHFFNAADHARVRPLSHLPCNACNACSCAGAGSGSCGAGTQVDSASLHRAGRLLVVGFSNGTFGLYTLPGCDLVHTLSISQVRSGCCYCCCCCCCCVRRHAP